MEKPGFRRALSIGLLAAMIGPVAVAADSLLATPDELKQTLDRVRVVDTRPADDFKKGHIPGAVNRPVTTLDNADANRQGLPLPLDKAAEMFRDLGIDKNTRVVVYDDHGGRLASRFFYVAEFFGHKHVRVLDGGWKAWLAAGGAEETEARAVPAGTYKPKPNDKRLATTEWIQKRREKPGKLTLIDARTPDEYAGKIMTAGGRAGRIPGAIHVDWRETTTSNGQGSFRPASELRSLYQQRGVDFGRDTAAYCSIGLRASQVYFTLRMLGHKKVRVYDGSWSEWGARSDLPAETSTPAQP